MYYISATLVGTYDIIVYYVFMCIISYTKKRNIYYCNIFSDRGNIFFRPVTHIHPPERDNNMQIKLKRLACEYRLPRRRRRVAYSSLRIHTTL